MYFLSAHSSPVLFFQSEPHSELCRPFHEDETQCDTAKLFFFARFPPHIKIKYIHRGTETPRTLIKDSAGNHFGRHWFGGFVLYPDPLLAVAYSQGQDDLRKKKKVIQETLRKEK